MTGHCVATTDELATSMGWIGSAAALLLFLVPLQVVADMRRRGGVGDFSCTPFVAALGNCTLWSVYALPMVTPCRLQSLLTNAMGCGLELFYIAAFWWYAGPRRREALAQLLGIACVCAGVCLFALLATPHLDLKPFPPSDPPTSKATTVLGFAASAFNILMYAAPLGVMRQVVRTRSTEFMPLGLTLAVGACSGAWFAYALEVGDDFILTPNVCGLALCVAQLALYARYCGGAPRKEEATHAQALISPTAAPA